MLKVTVVIPLYKTELKEEEQISLESIHRQFSENHLITIIKPESLDVSVITDKYPVTNIESFNDDYFKNIAGYNRLMLSEEFYTRFLGYEYILIAQTDCYIFRDELEEWCNKGYDYVGAPWLVRPVYKFPLLRLTSYLKKEYCRLTNTPNSQMSNNKVGNGGLSLRKVKTHLEVVTKLKDVASYYLNYPKRTAIFNEDVFFALEPAKNGVDFSYPTPMEALEFSFDKYPKYCNKLMNGKTPMGTHGWYKRKMIKYWRPIILKK